MILPTQDTHPPPPAPRNFCLPPTCTPRPPPPQFDEFDLLVEMEYFSTDEFLELIGANVTSHPGVNVHFSAGGPQVRSYMWQQDEG